MISSVSVSVSVSCVGCVEEEKEEEDEEEVETMSMRAHVKPTKQNCDDYRHPRSKTSSRPVLI